MRHGSLFSGIGGFDLAAEWADWDNVFHCEIEEYKRRRLELNFPNSASYGDITKTDFTIYRGLDVLTGGFPCQDASNASRHGGGQKGLKGERTVLFYEMCRAIREIAPKYVVAENVANILKTNGGEDFSAILTELSRMGYNAEWRVFFASEVGAPHQRARLYLVGYPGNIRLEKNQTYLPYVGKAYAKKFGVFAGAALPHIRGGAWSSEPPTICVDDGLPVKLASEQIHGYGNAIIPQIALQIFKAIEQYELIGGDVSK